MKRDGFRKQPLWFRILNKTWKSTYPAGTRIKLDKDELIKTARKKTGLKDLGSGFWDEPLDRLIRSIGDEANLHPIGSFISRERLINLLVIRLRAEYYFKKYPAILDQPLYPAWIIIGLQRTGTTKLHRLLSSDPDHRVIPSWEVINPVPDQNYELRITNYETCHAPRVTRHASQSGDDRIKIAKTTVRALKAISPGFFAIHPIDIYEPEEDILLLDVSFLSTTPEAMMHVPSYAQWLENTDQSMAYEYAVKLLKFLQWIKPAKRWVLKSPHHLEFPDLIEKHFEKVQFIWPHRNIYESIPSFCSMVTYNHMIFSDDIDPYRIAQHWIRKTGYMLQKSLNYRNYHNYQNNHNNYSNQTRFIDINYQNLVDNSVSVLELIYKDNGGISAELAKKFREHERTHPQQQHGVHKYSLEDFGVSGKDIDEQTSHYQDFIRNLYGRQ